jgi:hypothetical protein
MTVAALSGNTGFCFANCVQKKWSNWLLEVVAVVAGFSRRRISDRRLPAQVRW